MKYTTVLLGLAALATAQDPSSTTAATTAATNAASGFKASASGSVSGSIDFGKIDGGFNKTIGGIFDNDGDSDDEDDKKSGASEAMLGRSSLGYMVAAGVIGVGAAIL